MASPSSLPQSLRRLSLFSFQREALEATRRYITAHRRASTSDDRLALGAALVHMPTGSGKTGVIAALARCQPNKGGVLVLSPRQAIRDQLARELAGRFFEKLRKAPARLHKEVRTLRSSHDQVWTQRVLADSVVVCTIQLVRSLERDRPELFSLLVRSTDLLLFDEGHYEPAPFWRQTIRAFACPRVLFTATPFRNDLRFFDVNPEHSYSYSFSRAVQERAIRDVSIHTVDRATKPKPFLEEILRIYHNRFGRPNSATHRIIVRCDSKSRIRELASGLRALGHSYVAIHEGFVDGDDTGREFRHVPDTATTDAVFWIHQFKLLEGIDDPRFQLVGIYDEFRTVRSLVQQVGRVLRNPGHRARQVGYVVDASGGGAKELWENFVAHDKRIEDEGVTAIDHNARLLEAIREAHPPAIYVDGRFRSPAHLGRLTGDDLKLPLSVHIYSKLDGFSVRAALAELTSAFEERERVIGRATTRRNGFVLFSARLRNSPYLVDAHFLETRLCVTVVQATSEFVFFFDSGQFVPLELPGIGGPAPERRLRGILAKAERIRTVELGSASALPDSIRAKTLSARSMARVAPSLDDHLFFCRAAEGFLEGVAPEARVQKMPIRRAVRFGTGRVAQAWSSKFVPFATYLRWIDQLEEILEPPKRPVRGLARYARSTEVLPSRPAARGLLFDLNAVEGRYVNEAGDPIELEEGPFNARGSFSVTANGERCAVSIRFDEKRGRYELASPDLDRLYRRVDPDDLGLVDALNAGQSFQVVPVAPGFVYAAGTFYRPTVRFGAGNLGSHEPLLRAVRGYSVFDKVTSEKGSSVRRNEAGWQWTSIFGLIDALASQNRPPAALPSGADEIQGFFRGTTLLACDDMGSEIADFVLLRENRFGVRSVVFIHAKGNPPSRRSAVSAKNLAEVCSQAVKNLGELAEFTATATDRSRKWQKPWTLDKEKRLVVRNRIRHGGVDGAAAWRQVRDYVQDPSTRREVWLFLGNILSKRALKEGLSADNPPLTVVHAAYGLSATMAATGALNAPLSVFCGR